MTAQPSTTPVPTTPLTTRVPDELLARLNRLVATYEARVGIRQAVSRSAVIVEALEIGVAELERRLDDTDTDE
jgi:O-succinylbenzoate synthase